MRTPIADFLREFSTRGVTRLHMPGHKGKLPELSATHDITEISGADVLYSPNGIIRESEEYAASLFGTARTLYSAEGSSLSIKAMLALVTSYAKERGERPLILAGRNAHKTFIYAAALLDFDIQWIYGESLMECKVTPAMLREAIRGANAKPTALYITSPDYLGGTSDIRALSEVCRDEGILLLVDNAHGAYLKFLPHDRHPITLGADMSSDSAHKTLPCLTGAGYLHISKSAPRELCERADELMALFASTSPSYLILESLDLANAYIEDGYRERLADFEKISDEMKRRISASGFITVGDEPLKITVKTKEYGYTGRDIEQILDSAGIVSEFADDDHTVLLLSPEFDRDEMMRVAEVFTSLPRRPAIRTPAPSVQRLSFAMSPREAMLSPSVLTDADLSVGKILASASVSCPPAVPVAVSGEIITKEAAECFKYYGTENIRVVKD